MRGAFFPLCLRGGNPAGVSDRAGRTPDWRGWKDDTGKRTYKGDSSDNLFKCPFFASDDRVCSKIRSILTDSGTGSIRNTLLIAPPRCGKTTLLRDLIRMVSDGEEGKDRDSALTGSFERPKAGAGHENKAGKMVEMRKQHGGKVRAQTVGVVDERSEIAACYQGIPQNDVGCRTDVLDACPKAEGMMMLIRSMAPEVVAVDEIGGENDLEALRYVMNCGCRILATVHGNSMEDIREKPGLSSFLQEKRFERYVVLGNRRGPGTVEAVYDAAGEELICG